MPAKGNGGGQGVNRAAGSGAELWRIACSPFAGVPIGVIMPPCVFRYRLMYATIEDRGDQMRYRQNFTIWVFAVAFLAAGLVSTSSASAHDVGAQINEMNVKWV